MPRLEGGTPEHHQSEQPARERQRREGEPPRLSDEIHEKEVEVVEIPKSARTLLERRISTILERMGGHHQLLGGTESTQREEIRRFVIAPEDIPQGYFANQQRLAREQGHGEIQITPELRAESARVIRGDQEGSLTNWVNYLNDPTASYPQEFKYFVLRNVLSMGVYDKEQGRYGKRTKGTTAPYPELSREALALVYDQYKTSNSIPEREVVVDENEKKKDPPIDPERFLNLLKPTEFGKDYAKALEITRPKEQDLSIIEGEWITFPQTEDPAKGKELADFLQGKGTGWCTAGVETATTYLRGGDLLIFASYDEERKPINPRIAIWVEEGEVAEVRGIQPQQELEPDLIETAKTQLNTLSGGEAYQQKTADMKLLTAIEKKHKAGEHLNKKELQFLYELDRKIQGFGYRDDPRIKEIQNGRDKRQDAANIFECHPEQVAWTTNQVDNEVVVLWGKLEAMNFRTMPEKLRYVIGDVYLDNSQMTNLGELTVIKGCAWLEGSQITSFGNVTTIEGSVSLVNSQVSDLGKLSKITGEVWIDQANRLDREKLEKITQGEVNIDNG